MKKAAILFILAIVLPSLVLARLSLRSADNLELVLRNERIQLHRQVAARLLARIREEFPGMAEAVRRAVAADPAAFTAAAPELPIAEVAWQVTPEGNLISNARDPGTRARFLEDSAAFLTGAEPLEHFSLPLRLAPQLPDPPLPRAFADLATDAAEAAADPANPAMEQAFRAESAAAPPARARAAEGAAVAKPQAVDVAAAAPAAPVSAVEAVSAAETVSAVAPDSVAESAAADAPPVAGAGRPPGTAVPRIRSTLPAIHPAEAPTEALPSQLTAVHQAFADSVAAGTSGIVSYYAAADEPPIVLVWFRPQSGDGSVFGIALRLSAIMGKLAGILAAETGTESARGVAAALLDRSGAPVATSTPHFTPPSWTQPFTALEIGEALPYWEVATYVKATGRLSAIARAEQIERVLAVWVIVAAIGFGSMLIFLDLRRQWTLARQQSEFVSSVSHELKTPLTSIRMFAELLRGEQAGDPATTRRYAEVIGMETQRLTRLIDNVLDMGRIERGDKTYAFSAVDLAQLVDETLEQLRPQLEREGFALRLETPDSGEVQVWADSDAISQVLVNLLSNAMRHGAGDNREVTVRLATSDSKATVEVCDRGPGVPAGHEGRVFEKFHRAGVAAERGGGGSGLGLALAREIAAAHEGSLHYRTRTHGGSCFSLSLPARATRSAAEAS